MITFKKGSDTKIVAEGSKLIERLIALGWVEESNIEPIEDIKLIGIKGVKNGKSSTTSN